MNNEIKCSYEGKYLKLYPPDLNHFYGIINAISIHKFNTTDLSIHIESDHMEALCKYADEHDLQLKNLEQ